MTTMDHHARMSTLDHACVVAERGLHVIPVWRANDRVCTCPRGTDCISPGKHPAIDSWQTAASTDLTVLRDWFAAGSRNVGVVCGSSNVCVVDVDPRNGGADSFAALVAELGPLPDTVSADSGGGGHHYVFRRPAGDLVSKLRPGVDLLHGSRQFLVEPSVHPSGGVYRWCAGRAPDEISIADLPAAWIKRATRSMQPAPTPTVDLSQRERRARAYLAKLPAAVSGNSGHTATFNAVAAVMIGFDLDGDSTARLILSDYNPRCDPPWSEREIAHKIQSAAKTCKRERGYLLDDRPRVTTPVTSTAMPPPTAGHLDLDWTSRLKTKRDGMPIRLFHNVLMFVSLHQKYRGRWSMDQMTDTPQLDGIPVTQNTVQDVRAAIEQNFLYSPSVSDVESAIVRAASERKFHPIRDYLRSLDWDGTPRLAAMAYDYLSSSADHHAEMLRRFMIGAVARVLQPGCKLDTALMLVGPQGYRKSTFFTVLGGQWHNDTYVDLSNKDGLMQCHGSWIYELSELENVAMGRAESRLKAWMSSSHDMFRAPYQRLVERRARSFVICGTSNHEEILTDRTGSRRSWIVPVHRVIDWETLASCRDQLWAEAVCAFEAGEPWWLASDTDDARASANEQFMVSDSWNERVAEWLANPSLREVTVAEVLEQVIKLELAKHDRGSQMRAQRALTACGWRRERASSGTRQWRYIRV